MTGTAAETIVSEVSKPRSGIRRARHFRTDIQALRALAVTLVVLNHLWPQRVTGGYVGVDVFFVISGYLITAHLWKEMSATGRVRLGHFYARRIRRLLPAAFVVLVASSVLTFVLLPFSQWKATAQEVITSALYVENWALAAKAVDYSASQESATAVQHYWSLSVEEQFYLLWPLALLVMAFLATRLQLPLNVILALGIAGLGIGSFILGLWYVNVQPNESYFATPVRVWEFAVGGLIAMTQTGFGRHRSAPLLLAVAGWTAIILAALHFDENTPFPGVAAALPVLGTAAVIVAGCMGQAPVLALVIGARPVQFVGNVSYSLYLWHWPFIVVAPFIVGDELSDAHKFGIAVLSLVLAWTTKVLVEDAGQRWVLLRHSTRNSFAMMAIGATLVTALAGAQLVAHSVAEAGAAEAQRQLVVTDCTGPNALHPSTDCPQPFGAVETTTMAEINEYWRADPACVSWDPPGDPFIDSPGICDFSQGDPAAKDVWLVGDSHAQHWQGAIMELAKEMNWRLHYSMTGGCAIADVAYIGYTRTDHKEAAAKCRKKGQELNALLTKLAPDIIFYSIYAREEKVDDGSGRSQMEQYIEGLPTFWNSWADAGSTVYVMADPPLNGAVRDTKCVSLNSSNPIECAVPRTKADTPDPLVAAFKTTDSPRIRLMDLTDYFCGEESCYAAVGGVAVYYNHDHLNREYSKMLAPMIGERL